MRAAGASVRGPVGFLPTAVLVSLLAVPGCGEAQGVAPPPLEARDFAVAGIDSRSDSAAVIVQLGPADSTASYPNPLDVGGVLIAWFYPDLIVSFGYEGSVLGLTLTAPSRSTVRGLRPGDPEGRIRELYGDPANVEGFAWSYPDPGDPEGMHSMIVQVEEGAVATIFLGYLLD